MWNVYAELEGQFPFGSIVHHHFYQTIFFFFVIKIICGSIGIRTYDWNDERNAKYATLKREVRYYIQEARPVE